MRTGYLGVMHPSLKILLTIITSVASLFLFSIIGLLLAALLFDMGLDQVFNSMADPAVSSNIGFLKYLQIIQGISLFIIPALMLAFAFFNRGLREFNYTKGPDMISVFWVLVIIILGLPVINQLSEWNMKLTLPGSLSAIEDAMRKMEDSAALLTDAFLSTRTYTGLAVNLFMIAIIPAIGEELFFRGLIQKFLIDWTRNPVVGILIASFFFSSLHLQFFGFLPRFYLGVLFGLMHYWSGTIWLPVIAHLVNNGTAVVVYFFMGKEAVEQGIDNVGTIESNWMYFVLSVVLVVGAMAFIHRQGAER